MRVTNKIMTKTYLGDLNKSLNNMQKYQEQLSSGKQILRPSDDPLKVSKSIQLNDSISQNEQYLSNIEESKDWMNTTDMVLGQIGDSLQRIRELTIASANGTNTKSELNANKVEIDQLIQGILQNGNAVFDGRYIFGGNKTTALPFKMGSSGIEYLGDSSPLNREISPNVLVDINISGNKIMNFDDVNGKSHNFADILKEVVDAHDTANFSKLSGDCLENLSSALDNILGLRGEMGAKVNRMESAKIKNEEETFNMTNILSKTEDIDIAQKMMEFKVMESVYQASLMTGAKILQPSLIEFLR